MDHCVWDMQSGLTSRSGWRTLFRPEPSSGHPVQNRIHGLDGRLAVVSGSSRQVLSGHLPGTVHNISLQSLITDI